MDTRDNATEGSGVTQPRSGAGRRTAARLPAGFVLGAIGVVAFSFSLPATRLAVGGLDPWAVAFGRSAVAGLLAVVALVLSRAPRPTASQLRRLAIVASGIVVGWPLLTSIALEHRTSADGAVIAGLLPAATAVMAVARAGERPSRSFWLASGSGLLAVLAFAAAQGSGAPQPSDGLLLVAVAMGGLGYAEGGALARELGGWRTICWTMALMLPLTVPIFAVAAATTGLHADAGAWFGFGYVAVVSSFVGFFAWYAGLARGGVARIGQVQLAQPLLTLGWSAALLSERVTPLALATAVVVLACVVATQRARVGRVAPQATGRRLPATI
jgi:drug/metabolite transporter (DMT)-like permease